MRRGYEQRRPGAAGARLGIIALVTAAVVGGAVPSALAHPFGPPLRVTVEVDGTQARATLFAPEDDWVILGDHVGAFDEPTAGALDPEAQLVVTGAQRLATSDAVRSYLAERIRVTPVGGDAPCASEVTRLDAQVLDTGAEVTVRCEAPLDAFAIEAGVLTDVHEAYRVLVELPDATPGRVLVTAADPAADVQVGAPAPGGGNGATALGVGLGALVLAVVGRRLRPSRGGAAPGRPGGRTAVAAPSSHLHPEAEAPVT